MFVTTKAIVLSTIKYQDSSLIVKCYTQQGLKAYFLKGILSKKNKNKKLQIAYFQKFSLLEIIAKHNDKGNLNYIKEATVFKPLHAIHSNIYKSTIALFLSEILTLVIKEEEGDELLYNYLENALIWLDENQNIANFHLVFLLNLTKYLGFYPNKPKKTDLFFHLKEGVFTRNKPISDYISDEKLIHFKSVFGTNFDTIDTINLNTTERQKLLQIILNYFNLHLPEFYKPKSLTVLKAVFK